MKNILEQLDLLENGAMKLRAMDENDAALCLDIVLTAVALGKVHNLSVYMRDWYQRNAAKTVEKGEKEV